MQISSSHTNNVLPTDLSDKLRKTVWVVQSQFVEFSAGEETCEAESYR
jgi:hypothetical protein